MAVHIPGSGASVNGTSYANPSGEASKERYTFGILASLEDEENRLERITERTDRVTISVELSRKLATIDLLLDVVASTTTEGNIVFAAATHYLVGSSFTPGAGGDSSPPNLAQAAMDAVVALKVIELNKARNPLGKTVKIGR